VTIQKRASSCSCVAWFSVVQSIRPSPPAPLPFNCSPLSDAHVTCSGPPLGAVWTSTEAGYVQMAIRKCCLNAVSVQVPPRAERGPHTGVSVKGSNMETVKPPHVVFLIMQGLKTSRYEPVSFSSAYRSPLKISFPTQN